MSSAPGEIDLRAHNPEVADRILLGYEAAARLGRLRVVKFWSSSHGEGWQPMATPVVRVRRE
jgi:hypothetical protein